MFLLAFAGIIDAVFEIVEIANGNTNKESLSKQQDNTEENSRIADILGKETLIKGVTVIIWHCTHIPPKARIAQVK